MKSILPWLVLALFGTQATSTISVETRLVFVDVVARDGSGHVVGGLKQDDFTVREDGKPQRIVFFEEHHAAATPATQRTDLDPRTVTNVAPEAADSDLNLLLFDLADTPVLDQPYARKQMIRFLQRLPPGHQVALFVLSDRLDYLQGFTGDSATLASAARLINIRELHLTNSESQRNREAEDLAYFAQGTGGMGSHLAEAVQDAVEGKSIHDEKVRTALVVDAFRSIARSVSGYSGRKNLLWLSENFPVGLADTLHTLRTGQPGETGTPALDSIHAVSDGSVRLLMDSQIAVYPIDVGGVETDSVGADLSGLGTAVAPNTTDPVNSDRLSGTFERRQFTREFMNRIADATGGRAVYGTNDLSGALATIVEETGTRYTLAYRPPDRPSAPGVRQIRVAVKQHAVALFYRHSYVSSTTPAPSAVQPRELLAAMRPGLPPSTGLRLTATPLLPPAGSATVLLNAAVNVEDITLSQDREGRRHGKLQVMLVALPGGSGSTEQARQALATLNLDVDPAQYATLTTEGVRFHPVLNLPQGAWSLRLGVMDLSSGQIGTVGMPITVK